MSGGGRRNILHRSWVGRGEWRYTLDSGDGGGGGGGVGGSLVLE